MSKEETEAERIIEMYQKGITNQWITDKSSEQCALIHVQGIIDAVYGANRNENLYWQRVKTIIENK